MTSPALTSQMCDVTGRREFVESVVATEDERGRTASLEHADEERDPVELGDPDR